MPEACPGDRVFDVGSSCGVESILTARTGAQVLELDVKPEAVRATWDNAHRNGVSARPEPQAMIRVYSFSHGYGGDYPGGTNRSRMRRAHAE